MATKSDLFKRLNKPAETVTTLIERDPVELLKRDQSQEIQIHEETDTLLKNLTKEDLIPNMLKLINQDVKARSCLIHAYGAVRDLGIVIQKASEIVQESEDMFLAIGSDRAIEIAKKNIPDALEVLNQSIVAASELEGSAIGSFADDSRKLFEIIGPEAGDFLKRREDIEKQVDVLNKKENDCWDEYVKSVAEANRYAHLYKATLKYLTDEQAANASTNTRISELESMNKINEKNIEDIKTQIIDSVTVKYRSKYSLRKTNKTTFYEMSKNPDRDAEMKYYESLILGRMARLQMEKDIGDLYQKKITQLTADLSEYEGKYQTASRHSENLKKQLDRKLEALHKQIDEAYKKLDELSSEQSRVEEKMGLSGNALLECLIHIHQYSREIKEGSNAYGPLVLILTGIKSMVKSDVDMLSGNDADIFLSANRLSKMVGFIAKYYVCSRPLLEPKREKKQLSITNGETKDVAQTREEEQERG